MHLFLYIFLNDHYYLCSTKIPFAFSPICVVIAIGTIVQAKAVTLCGQTVCKQNISTARICDLYGSYFIA